MTSLKQHINITYTILTEKGDNT